MERVDSLVVEKASYRSGSVLPIIDADDIDAADSRDQSCTPLKKSKKGWGTEFDSVFDAHCARDVAENARAKMRF